MARTGACCWCALALLLAALLSCGAQQAGQGVGATTDEAAKVVDAISNRKQIGVTKNDLNQSEAWRECVSVPDECYVIELANEGLTGDIPADDLAQFYLLSSLELSQNNLTGTIPEQLADAFSVFYIDLGQNKLEGTIPERIGELFLMFYLALDRNRLEGTLPASLGDLTDLTILDLFDNNLTGELPPSLSALTALEQFNIEGNKFQGQIPEEYFTAFTNLKLMMFADNELSGTLPASIKDLSSLENLDLGNNNISGSIPEDIGNLTALNRLDLLNNNLSGTIPDVIGAILGLNYLDLRGNRFEGIIPPSLGSLEMLTDLKFDTTAGEDLCYPRRALLEIVTERDAYVSETVAKNLRMIMNNFPACPAAPPWSAFLLLVGFAFMLFFSAIFFFQLLYSTVPQDQHLEWLAMNGLALGDVWSDLGFAASVALESGLQDPIDVAYFAASIVVVVGPMVLSVVVMLVDLVLNPKPWRDLYGPDATASDKWRYSLMLVLSLLDFEVVKALPWSVPEEEVKGSMAVMQVKAYRFPSKRLQYSCWFTYFIEDVGQFIVQILYIFLRQQDEGSASLVAAAASLVFTFADMLVKVVYPVFVRMLLDKEHTDETPLEAISASFMQLVESARAISVRSSEGTKRSTGPSMETIPDAEGVGTASPAPAGGGVGGLRRKALLCCGCLSIAAVAMTGVSLDGAGILTGVGEVETPIASLASNLDPLAMDTVREVGGLRRLQQQISSNPGIPEAIQMCLDSPGDCPAELRGEGARQSNEECAWPEGTPPPQAVLPKEIGMLTNLTRLELPCSNLVGDIPAEISNLSQLIYIDLGNNRLEGSIPDSIGMLEKLQVLNLERNDLQGTIPESVWDLTELTTLDLFNNSLEGTISDRVGDLSQLQGLMLDGNELTGTIPSEIRNLTKLQTLELQNNRLEGFLPDELSFLLELTKMSLHDNQLQGTVPAGLSNLTKMEFLTLENNKLTLPEDPSPLVENMTKLFALGLNQNPDLDTFEGRREYQACFYRKGKCKTLDLSQKDLKGQITDDIGSLEGLTYLDLRGNELQGEIPISLGELPDLTTFLIDNTAGRGLCYNRMEVLELVNERFSFVSEIVAKNFRLLMNEFPVCPAEPPFAAFILLIGLVFLTAGSVLFFTHLRFSNIKGEHHIALLAMNALALGDVWSDIGFVSSIALDTGLEDKGAVIFYSLSLTCIVAPMALAIVTLALDYMLHAPAWRGVFRRDMSWGTKLRHALIMALSVVDFEVLKALNWKYDERFPEGEEVNELEFHSTLLEYANYTTYAFEDIGQFVIQIAYIFTRQLDDENGALVAAAASLVFTFADMLSKVVYPAVMYFLHKKGLDTSSLDTSRSSAALKASFEGKGPKRTSSLDTARSPKVQTPGTPGTPGGEYRNVPLDD